MDFDGKQRHKSTGKIFTFMLMMMRKTEKLVEMVAPLAKDRDRERERVRETRFAARSSS